MRTSGGERVRRGEREEEEGSREHKVSRVFEVGSRGFTCVSASGAARKGFFELNFINKLFFCFARACFFLSNIAEFIMSRDLRAKKRMLPRPRFLSHTTRQDTYQRKPRSVKIHRPKVENDSLNLDESLSPAPPGTASSGCGQESPSPGGAQGKGLKVNTVLRRLVRAPGFP